MTCAMHLQDPCNGDVRADNEPRSSKGVPLCQRHRSAWIGRCGPFRTWTRTERSKWARWAAARAKRQAARRAA